MLAAGIVTLFLKPEEGGEVAQPTPTLTAPTEPATTAPPEPTPEPTTEPTEEPTEEPSPTPEPANGGGNGNGGGGEEPVLAETGGPVLPWLVGGTLMTAAGAGLWRLRRRPD